MNEWMNEWMNERQPLSERSYKRLSRTPLEVKDSIEREEHNAIRYISRHQTGWPHLTINTGSNKLLWIRFLRGDWEGLCSVKCTKHVPHVLTTCSTRLPKAKRCTSLQQTRRSRVPLQTEVWSCTHPNTEEKCGLVPIPALNRNVVLYTPHHWTEVWSCTHPNTEKKCGLVPIPALNRSVVLYTPQHNRSVVLYPSQHWTEVNATRLHATTKQTARR
jgi:hypothetical protein